MSKAAERYYAASQWQLMWRKLKRHRLAVVSGIFLGMFYFVALFAEFFTTQDMAEFSSTYAFAPPQRIHFVDEQGVFHLQPFVYDLSADRDPKTLRKVFVEDTSVKHQVQFFTRGEPYVLWGLIPTDLHLMGTEEGPFFIMGADRLGRDLFSRIIMASRVSLTIGLVGVTLSFVLGTIIGGISGYFGGAVDTFIQRIIEFLSALPTIPLWMALSTAVPLTWDPIAVYFAITVVLSIIGWTGLARIVRGKIISLREEDYVMAARISNARESKILLRHLIPNFASYLIVSVTLAIPGMILGETALSFLGLGLRPPVVSWGVLLQDAMNLQSLALYPWLLVPGLFVIFFVLCFNLFGDGLRDAADPYK
ncbi:MAG: ABC transporter permease [Chloroflexi bacterium]|nr:ABC transporter permease [Chloroflexota bacterium]